MKFPSSFLQDCTILISTDNGCELCLLHVPIGIFYYQDLKIFLYLFFLVILIGLYLYLILGLICNFIAANISITCFHAIIRCFIFGEVDVNVGYFFLFLR
jgi:hypothetical protein